MKLKDFSFDLPEERIARFPSEKRSGSRLMVIDRAAGNISHRVFSELPLLIDRSDFLVINNTKVDAARIFSFHGGKQIEVLIIRKLSGVRAEVFAMPARKLTAGVSLDFGGGRKGIVESIGERGRRTLCFNCSVDELISNGFAPLPPYIKRKFTEASEFREFDLGRYQTVYSRHPGSIAAPTAGLHFDEELLEYLRDNHEVLEITLSVGPATFQKIKVEDITEHRMGTERISVSHVVSSRIRQLKSANCSLIAVGTTSVRSLETLALKNPAEEDFSSDLFISPGFKFRMVDKLITNFHLPESSLFILVSAFAGLELMREAYRIAVEKKYNFFSYGDAMLII